MTDLEDGFYWVRRDAGWEIAEHESDSGMWLMTGWSNPIHSSGFDEIDPRRIVREGGETK